MWDVHAGIAEGHTFGVDHQARAFLPVALYALERIDDGVDGPGKRLRAVDIRVSPLYNGRERGISIVLCSHTAPDNALVLCFGEERNSDRLFLWPWQTKAPFNMPPSLPDDDASYHERYSFPYLRVHQAEEALVREVERWLSETGVESLSDAEK